MRFKIKVTDRRGKFEPRIYEVEAESRLVAPMPAVKRFIADNNIPPYKVGKSISRYFGRFECEEVGSL